MTYRRARSSEISLSLINLPSRTKERLRFSQSKRIIQPLDKIYWIGRLCRRKAISILIFYNYFISLFSVSVQDVKKKQFARM